LILSRIVRPPDLLLVSEDYYRLELDIFRGLKLAILKVVRPFIDCKTGVDGLESREKLALG
jgi:hypothetical protein